MSLANFARYSGKRVLVVGSGHSAMNALLDLEQLATPEPSTRLLWAVRRSRIDGIFGGGKNDQLPERGRLRTRLRELVKTGQLQVIEGFALSRIARTDEGLVVSSVDRTLPRVDESSRRRASVPISTCCAKSVSTLMRSSRARARSRR